MAKTFIYPGSFDPFTIGHYEIFKQALLKFGAGIVAVGNNDEKSVLNKTLMPKSVRQQVISAALQEYARMDKSLSEELRRKLMSTRVVLFDGLQVDAAIKYGCAVIVRGIRNQTDRELEEKLAYFNDGLARIRGTEIETVLLPAEGNMRFVSSGDVKELCRIGEYIMARQFVAPSVHNEMMKIYLQQIYIKTLCDLGGTANEKFWQEFSDKTAKSEEYAFSRIAFLLNHAAMSFSDNGSWLQLACLGKSYCNGGFLPAIATFFQANGISITQEKAEMLAKAVNFLTEELAPFDKCA